MKKVAVCSGINKYPNPKNNLKGCVNDANGWKYWLLKKFKFDSIDLFLDKNATVGRVRDTLEKRILSLSPGDVFVYTNSSHGTTYPDTNGDEIDGRDEAICLYDGLFIDDHIRGILSRAPKGLNIAIISDSCHSGTVTRSFITECHQLSLAQPKQNYMVPRYLPPTDDKFSTVMENYPLKTKLFGSELPQNRMNEILLSGCSSTEFSYDAYFSGKFFGALSYNCFDILKSCSSDLTYLEFYKLLRDRLPSKQYGQTPQLEGSQENKNRKLFS